MTWPHSCTTPLDASLSPGGRAQNGRYELNQSKVYWRWAGNDDVLRVLRALPDVIGRPLTSAQLVNVTVVTERLG